MFHSDKLLKFVVHLVKTVPVHYISSLSSLSSFTGVAHLMRYLLNELGKSIYHYHHPCIWEHLYERIMSLARSCTNDFGATLPKWWYFLKWFNPRSTGKKGEINRFALMLVLIKFIHFDENLIERLPDLKTGPRPHQRRSTDGKFNSRNLLFGIAYINNSRASFKIPFFFLVDAIKRRVVDGKNFIK